MNNQLVPMGFTKEMAGVEIEAKLSLRYFSPVVFISMLANALHENRLLPYIRQTKLGNLNTDLQMWTHPIRFYGYHHSGAVHQVLMVAETSSYLVPVVKLDQVPNGLNNSVLVRVEDKAHSQKHTQQQFLDLLEQLSLQLEREVVVLGTIVRTKTWLYITNAKTNRNFGISADVCQADGRTELCQVEIEYKGRTGQHPPALAPIVDEILAIRNLLQSIFDNLEPTCQTKLEWLLTC